MESPSFIQLGTNTEYIFNTAHIICIWPETISVSEVVKNAVAHKGLPFDGDKAYCVCIRDVTGHTRNCVYSTEAIRDAMFSAISATMNPLKVVGPTDLPRGTESSL